MTFKMNVQNLSTVVDPDAFATGVAALALQLNGDFADAWDFRPTVVGEGPGADADAYQVKVVDDATSPGALGEHDTDPAGKPVGFVFAKTTFEDGEDWITTLLHEGLELRLDPLCATWAQAGDGAMRAFEACDAVEADTYPLKVGDQIVKATNFLLPYYFGMQKVDGERTDFLNLLGGAPAPALRPGGYDIVISTRGEPSQEFARAMAALSPLKMSRKTSPQSRTSRRLRAASRLLGVPVAHFGAVRAP